MAVGWPVTLKQFHCLKITVEDVRAKWIFSPPNMIIAPYPSYGHITLPDGGEYVANLHQHYRRVFNFLAINDRTQNDKEARKVRHKIYQHVKQHETNLNLADEIKRRQLVGNETIEEVNFSPSSYTPDIAKNIVEWMRNSVFCLQPPGDSNTRKAFYDAIMCGCIPVIFELPSKLYVEYPFESLLDYSQFTVKIPSNRMMQYMEVLHNYSNSSIAEMQYKLRQVLPYLQFNDPTNTDAGDDAFLMIMHEVKSHFKL